MYQKQRGYLLPYQLLLSHYGTSGGNFKSGSIGLTTGDSTSQAGEIALTAGRGLMRGNGGNITISGGGSQGDGNAGGVSIRAGDAARAHGGDITLIPGKGSNNKKQGQLYIFSGNGDIKTKVNNSHTLVTNEWVEILTSNDMTLTTHKLHSRSQLLNMTSKLSIDFQTVDGGININSYKDTSIFSNQNILMQASKDIKISGNEASKMEIDPSVYISNNLHANQFLSPVVSREQMNNGKADGIKAPIAKLNMINAISYSETDNARLKHFGFSISNGGIALPEIVRYGQNGKSFVSIVDLMALILECLKTIQEESEIRREDLIQSSTKIKSIEKQLLDKGKKNVGSVDKNKNDINDIKTKIVNLETLFKKQRDINFDALEESVAKLKRELKEGKEKDSMKKEGSKTIYSKEDDVAYFVKLMDESRESFYKKYESNESVNVDAEWKSQLSSIRAKSYRRVISRREEAKIFAIMDKNRI
eukprot:g8239.t1